MAGLLARSNSRLTRPGPDERLVARWALLGSLLAVVLDVLMLSAGRAGLLLDRGQLGSFFDIQGRAFLDGHLSVDPGAVGFEGFLIDGSTYLYFGPVPALLRLPVLLVTDSLDGRLTQVSMLLALVVLLIAGARVHWQVRRMVRAGAPVDRADAAAAFLGQVALGAGAVPLFLAGQAVVYHEAELWGAALSLASVSAILDVIARPAARRVVVAGALATLAINTRVSVGLGPVLALAAVTAGAIGVPKLLRAFGPAERVGSRIVALLVAVVLVPVGVSAAINQAKFDQPFGIPLDRQVYSSLDPNRKAVLAANDGSLFGAKYVPTTLLQAVRPDAIGATRAFPFIGLPRERAAVVGDVRFDTVEHSLSAPTSMPLFCLLALVGVVAAARRPSLRPLLGVMAGTAAGAATSLTIAYVTTRYLADFLPFLALTAFVGLQVLLGAQTHRRLLLGLAAALTLAGIAVNGSAGLVTQRLLGPETPEADRAGFVGFQDDVDRLLGRRPGGTEFGEELPPEPATPGDLFVLGDCDGLYVAGNGLWLPVERTQRSGVRSFDIRLAQPGQPPLVALGSGSQRVTVTLDERGAELLLGVGGKTVGRGTLPPADGGDRVRRMKISFDPVLAGSYFASVQVDGERVVAAPAPYDRRAAPRLSGSVTPVESPAPSVCRRLVERGASS